MKRTGIFLASLCLILISATTTQPQSPSLGTLRDDEIIGKIDSATDAHDLAAMCRLADSITTTFRASAPDRYGRLMLRVCDELGSFDFKNPRQYGLASELAEQASQIADKLSLFDALGFADRLRYDAYAVGPIDVAHFPAVRDRQSAIWLRAYTRIITATNRPYDPNFKPMLNWSPPGFEDVMAGSDPSAIADPTCRAAYAAAIAAHNEQAKAFDDHAIAERLLAQYRPQFLKYLPALYAHAPADRAGFQRVLIQYDIPAADRAELIKALDQEMPTPLEY